MKNWKKYCLTLNFTGSMAHTIIKYGSQEIHLRSTHIGQAKPWNGKQVREAFNVNVKVVEPNSLNCDQFNVTNFTYYTKDGFYLKASDKIHAFWCFVSDAQSATLSIDDFSSEFGYEKVSECLKVYNACQRQLVKYQSLGINGDICDLLNWLSETYNI